MDEIKKHINDTNASYRHVGAGDAKNTDLFLDNEHYELFRDSGDQITVRFHRDNLTQAILFIASILPRKFDQSANHAVIHYSDDFVIDQMAIISSLFREADTFTQVWNARKDVPQKNGKIDARFYFNGLLMDIEYTDHTGTHQQTKFTIRNYFAGGYSDLNIRKAADGIFDIFITNSNESYNDGKEDGMEDTSPSIRCVSPLQQIYYGAPGTGKSHEIKELTKGKNVIRTTFHPDSDYSTFVGVYKPTTKEITLRDLSGHIVLEGGKPVKEEKIVYEFVSQAFLQAYVKAWQSYGKAQTGETVKEQFLVIEEINRGNCAQIFGDLFQLLDRNEYGFSDYPIIADNDMKKQLSKAFADLDIPQREVINAIYKEGDIVQQVLEGDILLLPNNLFIWATMNTSDQSLFPIDSAFKRRWDWKYMPIRNADKKWSICADGRDFDWWDFIEKVNALIGSTTNSEDKKLGYFFCKTKDGRINADTFVGKVIFYLWNDVFKDYGFDSPQFKNADGELLTFDRFYNPDNSFNESIVARFLNNLEVNSWESPDEEDEEEYEGQNESEAAVSETDKSTWNDTEVKRYEFWKEFLDYAHQNAEFDKWFPGVKMGSKDHWKNFFIKGMDFHLVAIQQRRKNAAEVKVYFSQTNETFYRMQSHKDEIEKEMGVHYDWRELPNRKCSEISEIKLGVDYDNKDVWKELFDYFIDRLLRMREVFPKYAK